MLKLFVLALLAAATINVEASLCHLCTGSCPTYNADINVNSKHADFSSHSYCNVAGHVIFANEYSDSSIKYRGIRYIGKSFVLQYDRNTGPNNGRENAPIFHRLIEIKATVGHGIFADGYHGGHRTSPKGLLITGNKYLERIVSISHGNKRVTPFRELRRIGGDLIIMNNPELGFVDSMAFPELRIVVGTIKMRATRTFYLSRFERLYSLGGADVSGIKFDHVSCSSRLLANAPGKTGAAADLMGCHCPSGSWLNFDRSADANKGRMYIAPNNNHCQTYLPCTGIGGGDAWKSLGGGTPFDEKSCTGLPATASPTPNTNSPTTVRGKIGKITGPGWNYNLTMDSYLLFDVAKTAVGQPTGFRLWFELEQDVNRNGYIKFTWPAEYVDVITNDHPECYLWAKWNQIETGEQVSTPIDFTVTSQEFKAFVGDYGLKQQNTHMLECYKFDLGGGTTFKMKSPDNFALGTVLKKSISTYDADGNQIDQGPIHLVAH